MRIILVADENADTREFISLMFFDYMDYRVATASSGVDAISKAKKIKPDIVLADVSLSDKDGYEISREIKNNPLLKNTPVILLVSSLETFDKKAADALADDFMIKPFNPKETIKKVESLIKQYEKKEDENIIDKRGSEPFGAIRLSVRNRENHYELTRESAQELKTTTKKAMERRNVLNQIPTEAEYPRVPLYRRRDLIAVLSLSTVLLVTLIFTLQDTHQRLQQVENRLKAYEAMAPQTGEKVASRVLGISASDNGSQSRLNLDSETPAPDSKSLEETPDEITPVRDNIGSEQIKAKTSSLKGRTRKIHKWKTKELRGHTQPLVASHKGFKVHTQPALASNINEKELLKQQLRTAFLLPNP